MVESYSLRTKINEQKEPITSDIEIYGASIFLGYSAVKGIIKGVQFASGVDTTGDIIESEFHRFISTYGLHFWITMPIFTALDFYNCEKFPEIHKFFKTRDSSEEAVGMGLTVTLMGAVTYGLGYLAGNFFYDVFSK